MVDVIPFYVMGGAIGAVVGLIPCVWQNMKVPEARFFTMARLKKNVIVRVHYADEVEKLYQARPGVEGLILEDTKTGKKLALDPRKFSRRKCAYSNGLDYVDVGSNSIWPIGQREGILVSVIDDYIDDPANCCDFLKSRDQLERHTLLQAKAADLPGKIAPMLNIDPASVTVDTTNKNPKQVEDELILEFNKLLEEAIAKVIAEVEKVHNALEGKAVFTQPFSWADACFAVNSNMQAENVGKLDIILQKMALDKDSADKEKWQRLYMGLLVFGAVVVAIIGAYKLLFG